MILSDDSIFTHSRSESVCPLILWIWLSVTFVVLALAEYFVILLKIKFKGLKVMIIQ